MDQEHLEKTVRVQSVLLKISQTGQKMSRSQDLETVMQVCLKETQEMGLDICTMALHLLREPERDVVETYRVGPEGIITFRNQRESKGLTPCWRSGKAY